MKKSRRNSLFVLGWKVCPVLPFATALALATVPGSAPAEIEEDIPIHLDLLTTHTLELVHQHFPNAKILDAFEGEREEVNLQIVRLDEAGKMKLHEQSSDESFFATEEVCGPADAILPKARAAIDTLSPKDAATSLRRMERLVYKLRVRKGDAVHEYLVTPTGKIYEAVEPGELDPKEEQAHDLLLRPAPKGNNSR